MSSIIFFNKEDEASSSDFVYSSYCAGYTIKDSSYISQLNFGKFDYYYLMACPEFNCEDFDMPLDDIIDKFVVKFDYSSLLNGSKFSCDFIESSHKSNKKVLLSLLNSNFVNIARFENRRNNFAIMISELIKKYNYDGFDLDWEDSLDIELHYLFLKKLREELSKDNRKYYYLTTALFTSTRYSKQLADSLSAVVDWINLMTYDLGGGTWSATPFANTPMNQIEKDLHKWDVFPQNKLCIGLASYGFKYMNLKPGKKIQFGRKMSDYSSYIVYPEILKLVSLGWVENWNELEHVPYYFSPDGNSFITADNPRSIAYKIQWTINNGYRGLFWWELYHDFVIEDVNDKYGKLLLKDTVSRSIEGF